MESNPANDASMSVPTPTNRPDIDRGRGIVSLVMIVAGLLFTVISLQLDRGDMAHPGPGFYPVIIGVLAIISGVLGLLELKRRVPVSASDHSSGLRPWLFLGAMGLGVALLSQVGYAVSALVAATVVSWVAGQRTWWKALLTGVLIALITTYLFRDVLDVFLPTWIVDEWL